MPDVHVLFDLQRQGKIRYFQRLAFQISLGLQSLGQDHYRNDNLPLASCSSLDSFSRTAVHIRWPVVLSGAALSPWPSCLVFPQASAHSLLPPSGVSGLVFGVWLSDLSLSGWPGLAVVRALPEEHAVGAVLCQMRPGQGMYWGCRGLRGVSEASSFCPHRQPPGCSGSDLPAGRRAVFCSHFLRTAICIGLLLPKICPKCRRIDSQTCGDDYVYSRWK